MVEPRKFAAVKHWKTSPLRGRRPAARQHDAVERISANDEAASRINDRGCRGIVKGGIEHGQVTPATVPRRPVGPANARFDSQLFRCLPVILKEQIRCSRHPWRLRLGSKFGVVVEKAKSGVTERQPCASGTTVEKAKCTVLVIRGRRRCRRKLNHIVLSRALNKDAPLDQVILDDL